MSSSGNGRRSGSKKKKKGRLRYDRVIAVLVLFIVLIVIMVSCIGSCADKKNGESSGSNSSESSENSSAESSDESTPENSDGSSQGAENANFKTENIEYSDMNKGDLILVNSSYEYKFTEELNIVDVYSTRNDCYTVRDMNVLLENNVISQLNALMEAYSTANNNKDIRVIEGYLSKEEQDEKFAGKKSNVAGGYSDFNTARTFELASFPENGSSYYLLNEGVYSWIYSNAQNYGFILRYPMGKDSVTGVSSSTYTFRYVGVPHAIYISQNNITLEEYIEALKSYNKDNPLKITDGSKNYDVYYVQANANNVTEVPVPNDKTYSISGNNVDGFIVTVTLN
ncbi:MAG: D-alanyl-D-alanine carboxypeptidase family protein [Oscillospiraceae bacterium]|nr:D-alanyl-D-alanine carboxypeptidase family protein [Oscillospiraceae bacterium]